MLSGGSTQVDTLKGASMANTAQPAAGGAEGEEAEEGELEPGERAAGWDSGPEEEAAGRPASEPAGPEGISHTCLNKPCLVVLATYLVMLHILHLDPKGAAVDGLSVISTSVSTPVR